MSKEFGDIPQVFKDFLEESKVLDQIDSLPTPRERMENLSSQLESYYCLGEEDFNGSIKVIDRSYCERAIIANINESDIQNLPSAIREVYGGCDIDSSERLLALLLIEKDENDMTFTMALSVRKDKDTAYAFVAGFNKAVIDSPKIDVEQVGLIEEWAGWVTGIIDSNRISSR